MQRNSPCSSSNLPSTPYFSIILILMMDDGNALPKPTRFLSWQLEALHSAFDAPGAGNNDSSSEDDLDEASSPPIPCQSNASDGSVPRSNAEGAPPLPQKSPLRLRPEPLRSKPIGSTRNFSHPFKHQPVSKLDSPSRLSDATPKRILNLAPPNSLPQGRIRRVPVSLRRVSSLETIHSVTTTRSTQEEHSQDEGLGDQPQYPDPYQLDAGYRGEESGVEGSAEDVDQQRSQIMLDNNGPFRGQDRRYIYFKEQQSAALPQAWRPRPEVYQHTGATTLVRRDFVPKAFCESEEMQECRSVIGTRDTPESSEPASSNSSIHSVPKPTAAVHSSKHSSESSKFKVLRKFKGLSQHQQWEPKASERENRASIDQHSMETNSSGSVQTISSEVPSDVYPSASTSTSGSTRYQSSKGWKASNYDTDSLSEKDLKRCKKKGINPALYAEMKAARKNKLISPIIGNTIL